MYENVYDWKSLFQICWMSQENCTVRLLTILHVSTHTHTIYVYAHYVYTHAHDTVMTEQLSAKHGLALRSLFSNSRGFYLQTNLEGGGAGKEAGQLPDAFIKVVQHKNSVSFTTFDLMRLNSKCHIYTTLGICHVTDMFMINPQLEPIML